jgi:hypothetical protein
MARTATPQPSPSRRIPALTCSPTEAGLALPRQHARFRRLRGSSPNPSQARPAPRGFAWPRLAVPLAFVETGGYRAGCAERAEAESKSNAGEAARVIELLKGVLAAGELSPSQVGLVTPYSAQVRLLRQLWRDACHQATAATAAAPKKGSTPLEPADAAAAALAAACADPRSLEIASVDNFQGREKVRYLVTTPMGEGAPRPL